MAGKVLGTHFEAEISEITIFGWNLARLSDGSWKLGIFQVAPSPVAPDIEALIQSDIDAGNGDKIDHVLINEKKFACLYCEGRIKLADMQNAVEDDNSVSVPNIMFLGKPYTVKVMTEVSLTERFGGSSYSVATITAQGEIV